MSVVDLPFLVTPSLKEEVGPQDGEPPEATAQRLALMKAQDVAGRLPNTLVVGADTLVVLHSQLLGKPRDAAEAREMLMSLRGRRHRVITGVALIDAASRDSATTSVATAVTMRHYSEGEVMAYVASGEPLDKAGAYGIQDPLFRPVARVEGCYLNVVGLPLCRVVELLATLGVKAQPQAGWRPPQKCQRCPLQGAPAGGAP